MIVLIATHVDKLPVASSGDGGGGVQQRLQDIMYTVKDAECRAVENVKAELHALQSVILLLIYLRTRCQRLVKRDGMQLVRRPSNDSWRRQATVARRTAGSGAEDGR